ncbi:hypothetical protein [Streptomyces sp. NPDC093591]|uniref:hypothetical protein n=1 Tax=Streptomyces sp. NPDC093591 TaxID=3366044 RepID=UPI003804EE07
MQPQGFLDHGGGVRQVAVRPASGDLGQALSLHLDGWMAARNTGDARAEALALEGLAGAHALAGRNAYGLVGRNAYAAMLLGAAHAARNSVGMPLPPAERGDVDRTTKAIREHLDDDAYRTAYRRGSQLTPEGALSTNARPVASGNKAGTSTGSPWRESQPVPDEFQKAFGVAPHTGEDGKRLMAKGVVT